MKEAVVVSTNAVSVNVFDSIGRFVANVGVPAAIAFFVLWQIGGKLDTVGLELNRTNTQLTLMTASCLPILPPQRVVP